MTHHLIHIGLPKTGSKFLQQWFLEHPELSCEPVGIAGFRDVYDIARQGASPDPLIRCRVTSYEGIAMPSAQAGIYPAVPEEKGVSLAAIRQACATLASIFPAAHILLVTRGFRSLLLSSYSEYVRHGGSKVFREYVSSAGEVDTRAAYVWHYDLLIDLYRGEFGERVIVLPYELLRRDPQLFVVELERRLGLTHHAPSAARLNPSLSPVELGWYPRLTHAIRSFPVGSRVRRALMVRYQSAIGGKRLGRLVTLLQRLRPALPVTQDLVGDNLVEVFRGRAERLRAEPLYRPYLADYLLVGEPLGAEPRDLHASR